MPQQQHASTSSQLLCGQSTTHQIKKIPSKRIITKPLYKNWQFNSSTSRKFQAAMNSIMSTKKPDLAVFSNSGTSSRHRNPSREVVESHSAQERQAT
jgi:hypothetical protein